MVIRNVKQKRLNFSNDVSTSIRNSDIVFICVGTPTYKNSNKANLKYVYKVVSDIKKKGAFKAALGRMTFLTSYSKRAIFFTYVTTLARIDMASNGL